MNSPQRPVLRYHGGKWKLAPWVIGFFPPHRVYVEPFGGGGSVLMRKARARTEIYNDLDGVVVEVFRVLRDEHEAAELARRLELTPFARDDYETWCYTPATDRVDLVHKVIARSFMGQSSKGVWQRSGFDTRINDDGYCSRVNALLAAPETVRQYAARLRGVVIENDDAKTIIGRNDSADTLFYIDPPYVEGTRNTSIYRHDMTDADHCALAEVLRSVCGMVVLSGYPCDLYDRELYHDWERHERAHMADGARPRTEVVWLNPACAARCGQADMFTAKGHRC